MHYFNLTDPFRGNLECLKFFKAFSSCLVSFKFESKSSHGEVDIDDVYAIRLAFAEVIDKEP